MDVKLFMVLSYNFSKVARFVSSGDVWVEGGENRNTPVPTQRVWASLFGGGWSGKSALIAIACYAYLFQAHRKK